MASFIRLFSSRSTVVRLFILFPLFAFGAAQAVAQDQQVPPPPPPPPPAAGQVTPEPPVAGPAMTDRQLDDMVSRIALYPDPLLAQVLTASTYWAQIPEAASWADMHNDLKGEALANAIREDNLQWDASVMALLPFPSVLDMMARDPNWTEQLGNAVLVRRAEVMDAVQRRRREAQQYGYLRPSAYNNVVDSGGYVEIQPVNPAYVYVPYYDPAVVYAPPAPGFYVGGAIGWGPAVVIGAGFYPFGWAHPYFGWGAHAIYFDHVPWGRTWVNRGYYVHPYEHRWVAHAGPRVEVHGHVAHRRP